MASIRTASIVGLALLSAVALAGCSPSPGGASLSSAAAPSSAAASASPVAVASSSAAPASSGVGAAPSVPKACTLITAAQFGAAVGKTVVASDREVGVFDSCGYLAGTTSAGASLVRALSRADFEKSVAASPGKKTSVTGAGDAAYSAVVDGTTVLAAWHAGVEVSLTLHASDPLAAEKSLANTAFAGLGN